MDFNVMLQKYAELIAKSGIHVQKGQEIFLSAQVDNAPFVRMVVEELYKAGAKNVTMLWGDDKLAKIKYENAPMEIFENIPEWEALQKNSAAKNGAGFVYIDSSDPDALTGIDPKKPAARVKAGEKAFTLYRENMDKGLNTWCIVATPSPKWAMKVFPGVSEKEAIEKLWTAICKAVRVDTENPIEAWENHKKTFQENIKMLDSKQFDRLHFESGNGTNITIGMLPNHKWAGGGAETPDGVYYFPNMPTEETFISPDRMRADGRVVASKPLCYQGTMIEGFEFIFKDGRITDFSAQKGYETLKELVETDEGSHRLGEVALVPVKSPISEMGILFYNTLFDENAACHLAIGRGFNECVQNAENMSKDELEKLGLNVSATHVDFMFGTADMKITGIEANGNETVIFENGNWAK